MQVFAVGGAIESGVDERIYLHLDGDPLYAPETSVPVGTMREVAVSSPLAQHVARIAIYRETMVDAAFERVIPDGAVRLIFDLGARRGCAYVAGPSACPTVLRLEGTIANLTVTLRPGAAAELLGLPAGALREQCVPLSDLWPREAEAIAEQLLGSPQDARCGEIVQATLSARLTRRPSSNRRRAMQARRALAVGCTVSHAAETLGVGERRLQQIFESEVGLSPRQVRRLARIHSCLRSLRGQPRPPWPEFAQEHGFFDQAHLSNEFSKLVGLTPTRFLTVVSGSSKTRR